MATVYLAHDLKHERNVALKVLHPELGAVIGADRFLQEIKTTARLQHPHILGLIDSGDADGLLFYVMPFVSGESLRQRLTREKQLSIRDALRIATEVAAALDYAHRHGVVHRDIKPENVLLHDGQAMVADFGIALAVTVAGGGRMTQTGMSLGTPNYMSPEQALGEKEITPRSDLYALGAMTYEMLTGDPPFTASTAQAVLAKVLTERPVPPSATRETVPAHVEAAILTALAKLPADRWDSARAFADALANPALTAETSAIRSRPAAAVSGRWRAVAYGTGALALVLAAALGWSLTRPDETAAAPVTRFSMVFPTNPKPIDVPGSPIAYAPDGSRIAFVGEDADGNNWLYVRVMGETDAKQLPGTRDAIHPVFSPDGQTLAFWAEDRVRTVPVGGGPVFTVCETGYPHGLSWASDGTILLAAGNALQSVPSAGGTPQLIVAPDSLSEQSFRWGQWSADGRVIAFTLVDSTGSPILAAVDRDTRRVVRLDTEGMSPYFVDGGLLVWTRLDGSLMRASFDARTLRIVDEPRLVQEGVRTGPARISKMGISRDGSYAYLGGGTIQSELILTSPSNQQVVLPAPRNLFAEPRLSPDGKRIVLNIMQEGATITRGDLWVYEIATGALSRLTSDSISVDADWSGDSRSVVFVRPLRGAAASERGNAVLRLQADGSGRIDTLMIRPGWGAEEIAVARDGRTFVLRDDIRDKGGDLYVGRLDSAEVLRPLVVTTSSEKRIDLDPEGKLLAYVSDESGRPEVYIRTLVPGGARWLVSRGGGDFPRWGFSGRELFYRRGDSVFVAAIERSSEPKPGQPRGYVRLQNVGALLSFDVMPDGKVLSVRFDLNLQVPAINFVLNGVRK